jgi:hypothetical protein
MERFAEPREGVTVDVPAKMAEARRALDEGHQHKASRILEQVVYETTDVGVLTQIRDMALKVRAAKGHELKFGDWHDILSEANVRLARAEKVPV